MFWKSLKKIENKFKKNKSSKKLIEFCRTAPPGCLQYSYRRTGSILSLNWKNPKYNQNTLQNITYAVCLPPACQTVIRVLRPDINSYFHIASNYSDSNNDVSANEDLCDEGKICIPANSRDVSQAECFCGGKLNEDSRKSTNQPIVYYPTTPNVITISFGPDFDPRNGFALNFTLYDCPTPPPPPPPPPTTSELSYFTWSNSLDILIWT